uniref:DM2 domain-containing protein n=1 Tax=viral metagenome TaxID=1070528 RepID=A0A6C0LXA4_9ZZZZ
MSTGKKLHTFATIMQELEELTSYTTQELDVQRKSTSKNRYVLPLIRIRNRLAVLEKHMPRAFKIKRKTTRTTMPDGLIKRMLITDELAAFLHVERGTKLSRVEVRRAISMYCHVKDDESRVSMLVWTSLNPHRDRDLLDSKDRRIVHPNNDLSVLLRYPQYVKFVESGEYKRRNKRTGEMVTVTDSRLYTYIITKLIECHFLKDKRSVIETNGESQCPP